MRQGSEAASLVDERRVAPAGADALVVEGLPRRACGWCSEPFEPRRPHARWCSKACRQAAWRFGREAPARARADEPLRLRDRKGGGSRHGEGRHGAGPYSSSFRRRYPEERPALPCVECGARTACLAEPVLCEDCLAYEGE